MLYIQVIALLIGTVLYNVHIPQTTHTHSHYWIKLTYFNNFSLFYYSALQSRLLLAVISTSCKKSSLSKLFFKQIFLLKRLFNLFLKISSTRVKK